MKTRTNKTASIVMTYAHAVKAKFVSFGAALKAAWAWFKNGMVEKKEPKTWCADKPTNYAKAEFNGVQTWGVYVDKAMPLLKQGDKIAIKTKAGELHIRTIGAVHRECLSVYTNKLAYRIYQLIDDAEVAKKATERYQAAKTVTPAPVFKKADKVEQGSKATNGWCNYCQSYCWGDCRA